MRTITKTGPQCFRFESEKTPGVPKGKLRVWAVRFKVLEFERGEFEKLMFTLLDSSSKEALELRRAMEGPPAAQDNPT